MNTEGKNNECGCINEGFELLSPSLSTTTRYLIYGAIVVGVLVVVAAIYSYMNGGGGKKKGSVSLFY